MFLQIASKLVVGLIGLLLVTRLLGKKTLSEITPFDLIYTLVLGGILEESLYDDKINILHFLFAVALWGIMIYFLESVVQKKDKINTFIKGTPSVLIYDGELNLLEIKNNHIEMEQLRSMLRSQNCFSLRTVKYAVLEIGGSISVMNKSEEDEEFSYLLVDESVIEIKTLQSIGKDKKWLIENLKEEGYQNLEEIVYAEWSSKQGLYVKTYQQSEKKQIKLEN
ncbi:DUF421 domain-containing protein [Carnobacterium sp. FSL W8-0810]|uniref:DUF421 domain-containing protein n=1 Tax=Carnobacterium sp. FSL W8-0810 TaxID=2954705 RepID=UPI0030FA114B